MNTPPVPHALAPAPELPAGCSHRDITVNGVRLHCVEAGEGPLVVLLHGFPEFWYSWRHQIPALVRAGFRVIAPDQRNSLAETFAVKLDESRAVHVSPV